MRGFYPPLEGAGGGCFNPVLGASTPLSNQVQQALTTGSISYIFFTSTLITLEYKPTCTSAMI
ncbi:MAG: hypothetical protein V4677_17750 [Bacteroidota bacterium]